MARLPITHAPLTAAAIYSSYSRRHAEAEPGSDDDWRRDHMGASIIGHKCDRFLWLSFRWAVKPAHDGQQLRLFDTGKREELRVIADLEAAGITVHWENDDGNQIRVEFADGHGGGSLDGVAEFLPDSDNAHVVEIKTHSKKSFSWLQSKGLRIGKPEHYVQLQTYMRLSEIDRGVYIAVCKDTDEVYVERVDIDIEAADKAMDRAEARIYETIPPLRMDRFEPPCSLTSKEGKTYPCQFWALCHEKQMPEKNCRTCVSATPEPCGSWSCEHLEIDDMPGEAQRAGCDAHCPIPSIVNATVACIRSSDGGSRRKVTFQFADGEVRES